RVRWFFKDGRVPCLDPDELQVEVSGSETSDDEAASGWKDLSGLGQGKYCGYLLKKSRRDPTLWRQRWCVITDDRLWLLHSKSEQTGRRGRRRKHSYSLPLVTCTLR
ncbi:unnamed protein product, partial [Discosporangium mesarthrocarpum]